MENEKVVSLMEEKAKKFSQFPGKEIKIPSSKEAMEAELSRVRAEMLLLQQHIQVIKKVLEPRQKKFVLLANYKHILETEITPIVKTPIAKTMTKAEKAKRIAEEFSKLTPEQIEKLKEL